MVKWCLLDPVAIKATAGVSSVPLSWVMLLWSQWVFLVLRLSFSGCRIKETLLILLDLGGVIHQGKNMTLQDECAGRTFTYMYRFAWLLSVCIDLVFFDCVPLIWHPPHLSQVDGVFVDLPLYDEDKVKVYISGAHVLVTTKFELALTFSWNRLVRVTLPNSYLGAVCGLCGNDNRNPNDDLTMKDGKQAANALQFAESWKVGEIPGCVNGCTADCPICGEAEKQIFSREPYCGILVRTDGPFKQCHGAIDPTPYLDDCVLDTCHYKGHHHTLCSAISAYVTACQAQGIQIEEWRSASFCSKYWNLHYLSKTREGD